MTTSGVAIGMKISRLVADAAAETVPAEGERDHRAEDGRHQRCDDADLEAQPSDSQIPCAPHGLVHAAVENSFKL